MRNLKRSADARDLVTIIQEAIERRHLSPLVAIRLEPTNVQPVPRHVTFFEASSFMEMESRRLDELVVDLLGALEAGRLELVLWVHSDGQRLRYFYGVAEDEREPPSPDRERLLRRALEGYFPGVRLHPVSSLDDGLEHRIAATSNLAAVGRVVGVPSGRIRADGSDHPERRGLDEALDGLMGLPFDLFLQCAPVAAQDLDLAERNLEYIVELGHQLGRTTLSENHSHSFSEAITRGVSEAYATTESHSLAISDSESETIHDGTSKVRLADGVGHLVGTALGAIAGAFAGPGGVLAGAKLGGALGRSAGQAIGGVLVDPVERTTGRTRTDTLSGGSSVSSSTSLSEARSEGLAVARQTNVETLDRRALALESLGEVHLERVRQMRALGAWRTSVHVAARTRAELDVISNMLIGTLRGEGSYIEPLRLLPYEADSARRAVRSLVAFRPPVLRVPAHPFLPGADQPDTMLASTELARWVRPPSGPIAGVLIRKPVHFARYLPAPVPAHPECVELGPVSFWGRTLEGPALRIPTADLARHVFVAGTTGAGKTTTVKRMLWEIQSARDPVPFLLIEPAKTEFKDLFDRLSRAGKRPLRLVIGPSQEPATESLRFNPFAAPAGIPLGRHAEAIKILLRSCFDLQESLPQLLEQLLFETYAAFGWNDLVSSITTEDLERRKFPTFASFLDRVPDPATPSAGRSRAAALVRRFGYESRVELNLAAALTVRIESFTRGLKGQIFCNEGIDFADLLQRPCFIELADVNEPDVRRFLVGALVLRLYAEREAETRKTGPRSGLRHLLVLEEAHHFLRDAPAAGPGAELIRQSNLLLADALSELRAFGQGILLADQAPGELSPAVLRCTATKLIHTLYHEADVRAIADAVGLDDQQRGELRRLPPGECVVSAPGLPAPVTCQVHPIEGDAS